MRCSSIAVGVATLVLASCAQKPKPQWLMPTPRLYQNGGIDPFTHLSAPERNTELPVFYATNRKRTTSYYSSGIAPALRFGVAEVGIGGEHDDWNSLTKASCSPSRLNPLPLRLVGFNENTNTTSATDSTAWLRQLDEASRNTRTKDVMIYVHGAKVEFFHSCAFAAEFAHFSGREITPVAFDWPTHTEVFSYITRIDIRHGIESAERLADLVRMISTHTDVRRIHLVSWSAGARVLSRAMVKLGGDSPQSMRSRHRIGTTVFAASDVPEKDFIERIPAIHALSDRVLVYLSDDDKALKWSSMLMGGGRRLGVEPEKPTDEEIAVLKKHPRLQVIDSSYGKVRRGFDITGHRYWYQHPWISSDLILTLRTGASPDKRGLKPTGVPGAWWFPPEYGDRIGGVARTLTGGKW
jgi:esterase/lipase superfamily enzyme